MHGCLQLCVCVFLFLYICVYLRSSVCDGACVRVCACVCASAVARDEQSLTERDTLGEGRGTDRKANGGEEMEGE